MLNRKPCILPLFFLLTCAGFAQDHPSAIPAGQLDPTRTVAEPVLFSSFHTPAQEQYIWTSQDSAVAGLGVIHYTTPGFNDMIEPHYFRAGFDLDKVPNAATLYLAGPRSVVVYVNGTLTEQIAADSVSPLDMHVFSADITKLLKPGRNLLAIEAVRGHGVPGFVNSVTAMQQIFGEVLVAKIVPAAVGIDAPALLISGPQWKGTLRAPDDWERPGFNDAGWPAVAAIGPIEGSIDFLQWNADAGLYDWPGYEGESPFLAHMFLPATRIDDVTTGRSRFENLGALMAPARSSSGEFSVELASIAPGDEYAPGLTLDFGREVTGRVELISDSDANAVVSIRYGESEGELDGGPYLGVNVLRIAPHQAAHGPKSAFRFARIRFLAGAPELKFRAIHLEDIYYPVRYQGDFESSDPLLNRIWETGAYTAHLCMQDDIWDAPKRDRGRWMGDSDVSGRVSDSVFADRFLLKDTLSRLIGDAPVEQHVNGIPGYSSFWFTELQNYERHTGDRAYLEQVHPQLLQLLQFMDREFDAENNFTNRTKAWLFVDWAPGLNGDNAETRRATTIEYYRAYLAGADLLRQLGDTANADFFEKRAAALKSSLQKTLAPGENFFGPRLQTNAIAVLSGVADPTQYDSIWQNVLSKVGEPSYRPDLITPYYGAYVLDAFAKMGHRAEALNWIREYWGGMIAEGATSFWEAYDPSWPKDNPHVDLEADDRAGYFVSLAHGWSSGPTYWLMEQVLGIQPVAEGFSKTVIRPDLVGLEWARGQEPTPNGLLKVDLREDAGMHAVIDLPAGVNAIVLFPIASGADHVIVNGTAQKGPLSDGGTRMAITIDSAGHYDLGAQSVSDKP